MTSATAALQARRVLSRRSTSTRAERSGGGHPYDQPARRWIARVRVGAGAHTPALHLARRACEPPTPSCLPHPNQVATRLRSIVTRGPPQPRARPPRRHKWVAFLVDEVPTCHGRISAARSHRRPVIPAPFLGLEARTRRDPGKVGSLKNKSRVPDLPGQKRMQYLASVIRLLRQLVEQPGAGQVLTNFSIY